MAVLADHVAGSVAVAVFRVKVSSLIQKCLQDGSITSNASNVKRRAQILSLAVKVSPELREDLNHLYVALVTGDMQGCPPVGIALVEQGLCQLRILLD